MKEYQHIILHGHNDHIMKDMIGWFTYFRYVKTAKLLVYHSTFSNKEVKLIQKCSSGCKLLYTLVDYFRQQQKFISQGYVNHLYQHDSALGLRKSDLIKFVLKRLSTTTFKSEISS